ncbi:hypothetical protein B296_00009952 [Ensete ventricosum]|uniref:Sugar phosphate transporter domain-containing protein n=1 Tax=Ensete ventricosum TaxID=4639 RepID=A0A426ZQS7_ENSVE|nr:hypothetical protein B296_00009952 [Ensete ventricosum]
MGVWESILGKDGRRFVKRKDSDAGEHGMRLFFSRRTAITHNGAISELCGVIRETYAGTGEPPPSCSNALNALLPFLNLVFIRSVGFYQMAKIAVTPTIVLAEFMLFSKKVSLQKVNIFFTLCIISFILNFLSGFLSSKEKSPSVFSYILFSWAMQVITLGIVSVGVAVATVTDLEFNFFGACVALAWIVPSAVNKILWSSMQQTGNWTALA